MGAGTLVLGGPDTHAGATTVTAGTLTINGVGQVLNTSGVTLNPSTNAVTVGTLTMDNTGTNLSGRLMSGANPRTSP